ncbi:MAG: glycosyltransferase [Deltaproteobacteria bacterium]|nr:glycosyltransferase [Deltaproteobacteria bacterium]
MDIEVHQLLSNMDSGDAISNDAIELRNILRSRGYESNIYARFIHPDAAAECQPYKEHRKRSLAKNIAIFHHSIASEVSEYVRGAPDKKIMIYHNITPGHFFAPYDSHHAYLLKKGREDLKAYSGVPLLALGDSSYNAAELKGLDYPNVDVLPIVIGTKHLDSEPDKEVLKRYSDGKTNILFVGRIAPNKKIEDIIKAFYFFQKYIQPSSRLLLAGSCKNMENYRSTLEGLAEKLGAKDVVFTGHVKLPEIIACYRSSHLFLCMSEHEGFCVPLLEAMHFDIPVLAFESSAVPETMGYGGIVFKEKKWEEVAELMNIVLADKALKKKVIEAQRRRLKDFDAEKIGERFLEYIEAVRAL